MNTRMYGSTISALALAACVGSVADEAAQGDSPVGERGVNLQSGECAFDDEPTFVEFEACTARERATGAYVVDGDLVIHSQSELRAFYERLLAPESTRKSADLVVHRPNGTDAVWSNAARCQLSYCVSTAFGTRHSEVVTAMASAAAAWESAAGVHFVYAQEHDASCTAANSQVVFDVNPVSGEWYLARAFFPNDIRTDRNVLIDQSSFNVQAPLTLAGILRHELGHTLGFRHEHTRPESGHCFEDTQWRPLTPYDSASVMHYPQCNGTAGWALELSATDRQGAATLYGAGASCGNPPPSGVPFKLQTATALHQTGSTFEFETLANGDLMAIAKSGTGSRSSEVHVLSAASGYQRFVLQTGTALHETDGSVQFLVASNGDLFAIKKSGTGSRSTEVHVLSAASSYQRFVLQTGTALEETDGRYEFALASNRDLFAIKKSGTGSGSSEVHVLSAASGYRSFALQTGTALHETSDTFQFDVLPNRDVIAVKKSGTGTRSTEVHVLSARDGYRRFARQSGSMLHETDGTFEFEALASGDLMAVKKSGTGSGTTEVHVLDL